ncbi:hypothetical protein KCU81_g408, partial [Aureobasidium melanogenum]
MLLCLLSAAGSSKPRSWGDGTELCVHGRLLKPAAPSRVPSAIVDLLLWLPRSVLPIEPAANAKMVMIIASHSTSRPLASCISSAANRWCTLHQMAAIEPPSFAGSTN